MNQGQPGYSQTIFSCFHLDGRYLIYSMITKHKHFFELLTMTLVSRDGAPERLARDCSSLFIKWKLERWLRTAAARVPRRQCEGAAPRPRGALCRLLRHIIAGLASATRSLQFHININGYIALKLSFQYQVNYLCIFCNLYIVMSCNYDLHRCYLAIILDCHYVVARRSDTQFFCFHNVTVASIILGLYNFF